MWELLLPIIVENLGTLIAAGVAALFGWMVRKKWISEENGKRFETDVSGAVTEVYHEYVHAIKAGREDGKLTDEEKKEARARAVAKIKQVGISKGKDYIKDFGMPIITSLIEKYVQSNKK